jgi:BolA protein
VSTAAPIAELRQRLERALAPTALEIIDEGGLHVGHAAEGTGHFRVRIASAALAGKSRVEQHRMVYATLADLMGQGIHALAIEVEDG